MSTEQSTPLPPLQKPPGYRDPTLPIQRPQPTKAVKLPPSFQQNKRRKTFCRDFCCCLCIIHAILLIVLILAGTFFYVWFQPRLPEIHLKAIKFTNFNVSTTPDGPVLNAQSSVGIEIKNPNQNLGLEYGRTRFSLNSFNGDVNLGEQSVPGFTQAKNNVTNLKFVMKVENEILDQKSAMGVKSGFKSKNLLVNADVRTGIGLKGSGWTTGMVQVNVVCERMRLSQVREGGAMPKCRIKILDWISIN